MQGEPDANLVAEAPAEFEKQPAEVEDFRKITRHL
jgi:hypothetical protein